MNFCALWSTTGILWNQSNWKWNECSGSTPIPPIPVVTVVENPPGVDATTLIQPWQHIEEPWNPYKTGSLRKKIKLTCKVNGEEYSEEKEVGDYNVSVGSVCVRTNKFSRIDLDLKLEE